MRDDGEVAVICGGFDGSNFHQTSDSCYEYSLTEDTWTEASFRMATRRAGMAHVLLKNGRFLVLGGQGRDGGIHQMWTNVHQGHMDICPGPQNYTSPHIFTIFWAC